jgi:hypothetical protein
MKWEPKEETYTVQKGGLVSDVKKKYEQKGEGTSRPIKEILYS